MPDAPPRPAAPRAPQLDDELQTRAEVVIADGDELAGLALTEPLVDHDAPDVETRESTIAAAAFTGATLDGLRLTDVRVDGSQFAGVSARGADLARVRFDGCRCSGLVAPELRARDVAFADCPLDGAWLRGARLERVAFTDCDLRGADFANAELLDVAFLRCHLDEVDISHATFDRVALHGSTLAGLKGVKALRNTTIDRTQLFDLAPVVLATLGVVVDDDSDGGTPG